MTLWIWLPVLVVVSLFLTALLRRYALARNILDIPNARSSHNAPTPRGGGVAIVLTFLLSLPFFAANGFIDWPTFWSLLGAGAGVAVIGFLDDHQPLAARWRLIGHFFAAAWALAWFKDLPALPLPAGYSLDFGKAAYLILAIYLVWLLNLFNFMDGIDGIAGIETVTVCVSASVLAYLALPGQVLWVSPMVLAAAVTGFLYWNFPPAKIFMGDAGSGFLGLVVGVMSLQAGREVPNLFWAWVILMGAFVVDATITLCRRIRRGGRPHEAHRSHAYQHASRRYGNHKRVSIAYGLVNLFWLLPIAYCVITKMMSGLVATVVAYAPLVLIAFHFNAGLAESERPSGSSDART